VVTNIGTSERKVEALKGFVAEVVVSVHMVKQILVRAPTFKHQLGRSLDLLMYVHRPWEAPTYIYPKIALFKGQKWQYPSLR